MLDWNSVTSAVSRLSSASMASFSWAATAQAGGGGLVWPLPPQQLALPRLAGGVSREQAAGPAPSYTSRHRPPAVSLVCAAAACSSVTSVKTAAARGSRSDWSTACTSRTKQSITMVVKKSGWASSCRAVAGRHNMEQLSAGSVEQGYTRQLGQGMLAAAAAAGVEWPVTLRSSLWILASIRAGCTWLMSEKMGKA